MPDDCGCGSAARIADLKELVMLRIGGVETLANERFSAIDRALILKTEETGAHLKALNGEASRLREMQSTYLPREVAEAHQKETMSAIASLKEYRAGELGRQAIINLLTSAAVSAIIGAAALYFKGH